MLGRVLAAASLVLIISSQQLPAEGLPYDVKASLNKLVGKWDMETVVDGTTTHMDIEIKWSASESVVLFEWSGTDFDTQEKNSGSGMLGWDALRQVVVEYELDQDGASFQSTHHIHDGKWTSLTKGAIVQDGKPTYIESHRVFEIKSADEWTVFQSDRVIGGDAAPDVLSTFRRK